MDEMKVLVVGHHTLANRGCEAIVRSTVSILNERFNEVEILIPSLVMEKDLEMWPDAARWGVRFIPEYMPMVKHAWKRLQKVPYVKRTKPIWPFPLPKWVSSLIDSADIVLSAIGDVYSLDYEFPSLLMGITEAAFRRGKRVVLWGVSVGPFEKEPSLVPIMKKHLSSMSFIGARESLTFDYLTSELAVSCPVYLIADPAFLLEPEEVDLQAFWPRCGEEGVIGINISPYVDRPAAATGQPRSLLEEIATFIEGICGSTDMGILLIPHVIPWHGRSSDNDGFMIDKLSDMVSFLGDRVKSMPGGLNAPQTKHVISKCRFFIGARTHSTIAAMSTCVPTISLSYSVKSRGINLDTFGHTRWMIPAEEISSQRLFAAFNRLTVEETSVKKTLSEKMPLTRQLALRQVDYLEDLINEAATH